jgi:hypothetical protein
MPMEILPMNSQKQKRQRAVILTSQGFDNVPAAKAEAESYENSHSDYTLEVQIL